MATFKCKICGGALEIDSTQSVATCEYCGTKQTLPKFDDERRANLYDRANHFRRNNDFDKAMGIYENILNEDNTDAEAYWSIVLCRYGIEYVEDPATHKRVPTVNRAQFTSIFDDEDYQSALINADGYQREIYESEANAINEIQKGFLAISQKEEPFDVFICYKETDVSGRRTQDSVLATELYHELTREGFKVFFSRITLEDKLGIAYEPYIFAALNSAKVMVVVGTRPEHFNAVWVKNEWSRYLALIKNGAKKTLIPAYRNMDPYDLPEEFSHLQAQDMSKLGFMQDMIRGIKKIIEADAPKAATKGTVITTNIALNIAPLLKRAFMFLEDGEFDRADEFCEQVLNQDPENAEAYFGKLMVELRVKRQSDLANCSKPFDKMIIFNKIIKYADSNLKKQLVEYVSSINKRNEQIYQDILSQLKKAESEEDYYRLASAFKKIDFYKDATKLATSCEEKAKNVINQKNYATKQNNKKYLIWSVIGTLSLIFMCFTYLKWDYYSDSGSYFDFSETGFEQISDLFNGYAVGLSGLLMLILCIVNAATIITGLVLHNSSKDNPPHVSLLLVESIIMFIITTLATIDIGITVIDIENTQIGLGVWLNLILSIFSITLYVYYRTKGRKKQ